MDFFNKTYEKHLLSPVTLGQKEIWLMQQLSPHLSFNISEHAEIIGDLNVSLFEQAVNDVIAETPGLNSRFAVVEGDLYQFTDNKIPEGLHVIDINGNFSESFDLEAWVQKDITTLASVEDAQLYNFSLLCLPMSKFIFYYRCHHVLMDGRSMATISKRICEQYDCLIAGQVPEDKLSPSFGLQAKNDIDYLQSKRFLADEAFWGNIAVKKQVQIGYHS
ncbi:condensation domain-containing protein [Serratia sp. L9]|uniref:condensation domain-containing protein n=1 Tax=Serratia sp. L9 TaxID=3423946 RepID=UPI003D66B079